MKDFSKRSGYADKIDPAMLAISRVFSRQAEMVSDAAEKQYYSELALAAASHKSPLYPWTLIKPVFRSVDCRPVVDFSEGLGFVWKEGEAGCLSGNGTWGKSLEPLGHEGISMSRDEFAARFPHADLSRLPTVEKKMPSKF